MIALLLLVGIVVWVLIAIYFSKRIPRWLGLEKITKTSQVICFMVLLLLPIADELIGRWQFSRLCEQEALISLSPNWDSAKGAYRVYHPSIEVKGNLMSIKEQTVEYADIDTKKVFLTYKTFHTNGGLLLGKFGLGLGKTISCSPKNRVEVFNKINMGHLIDQGEIK